MTVDELCVSPTETESTMYADCTCLFCGYVFESLPWFGCCGRCYSKSESIRRVVDEAHPQTNAFAVAAQDALNAEVR